MIKKNPILLIIKKIKKKLVNKRNREKVMKIKKRLESAPGIEPRFPCLLVDTYGQM